MRPNFIDSLENVKLAPQTPTQNGTLTSIEKIFWRLHTFGTREPNWVLKFWGLYEEKGLKKLLFEV